MAEHSPGNPSAEQGRIPPSDTRLNWGYFQNSHWQVAGHVDYSQ